MRKRRISSQPLPEAYDEAWLTIVAAVSYFLFLYVLIHTAVTLDGSCLFTFWLPRADQAFSPYWLTVAIVILLVVWALFGLGVSINGGAKRRWSTVYYLLASIALCWWLYALYGFWVTMEYERGMMTPEEYYGERWEQISQFSAWSPPHQCAGI